WTYDGTGATISGTSNSIVIAFSSSATSGNLSVTASNACGTSASSATFAITANATPNSSWTPSTTTPTAGQNVTYTPADLTNQLYFWSTPGPVYSTSSNPTLEWIYAGTGNTTLTVTKNGCNSTTTIFMGTAHGSGTYA